MATTVSELIHSSFRLIGAIAAGELLETAELNDAFVSLNQMISSWNTEGASLVARHYLSVPVVSKAQYPLAQRPVKIEAASVSISGIDCPLDIVDSVGWEAIPEKNMLSIYVKKLFCDYGFPNASVFIWPLPRVAGMLEMWAYSELALFASLDQVIDMPPGYEAAVRYNFAVALLPEYPRSQADPTLPAQAQMYKASLVQLNASNHMRSQAQSPMQAAAGQVAQQAVSQ